MAVLLNFCFDCFSKKTKSTRVVLPFVKYPFQFAGTLSIVCIDEALLNMSSQNPDTFAYPRPCFSANSSSPGPSAPLPARRTLRLFLSGIDLPEPDARSRSIYAVLYEAHQTVIRSHQLPLPVNNEISSLSSIHTLTRCISLVSEADRNISSSMSSGSKRGASVRSASWKPGRSYRNLDFQVPNSSIFSHPDLEKRNAHNSSFLRAPHIVEHIAAPDEPTMQFLSDGTHLSRSAWTKIGITDMARKQGRDIEFSRAFTLSYSGDNGHLIRVALFDCTSANVTKQRLIGTAEILLKQIYEAGGGCVHVPLKFLPMNRKDIRRSARIPDGKLIFSGDVTSMDAPTYRLDIECDPITRTKALSSVSVKRLFYSIHVILDKDATSDIWTLLYRSHPVRMIHRKRDGGSLEYSHFSSRRLMAAPGLIFEDTNRKESSTVTTGLLNRFGDVLGMKLKERFFSLPGADITVKQSDTRLKLSLFEDNGQMAGYELIADTQFTISDLQERKLGDSSPIKVHSNVVGKAILKYVECSTEPRYFCLSLVLDNIR